MPLYWHEQPENHLIKKNKMTRLLILFILISNLSMSQEIENDAQYLFDLHLESKNITLNEYVKKHDVKSLFVLVNNKQYYSQIEFNEDGKIVSYLVNGKQPVRKYTINYDEQSRIAEVNYYNTDDSFAYGTYYKYQEDSTFIYTIKDSSLNEVLVETKKYKAEIIYNDFGQIEISKDKYYNDGGELIRVVFLNDGLKEVLEYEYLKADQYVTHVKFDSLNNEVSNVRYLTEKKIVSENKIEFYRKEDKQPFKIESYENDNLVSELYFNNDEKYKEIIYIRFESGTLKQLKLVNYKTNKKISYKFITDSKGRLTAIAKKEKNKNLTYFYKFLLNN